MFHAPGDRFHAVVTTVALPPADVWRTSNGRADTENRLRELKHAFGAAGFWSQRFWVTQAALWAICLLYNLIEEFQRGGGPGPSDARHPADDRVRVRGDPGPGWPAGRAAGLPDETLAVAVPRSTPPTPTLDAQLQCGCPWGG